MQKRWMAVAATAVLGNSLLAGFTSANHVHPARKDSSVQISFYEAMPGALGKELEKLTQAFEKANPNIDVQLVYNGSYTTQKQKLDASLAAQSPPTMAQVQETWETEYYNNNLLEPMQNLLPKSTVSDLIPIWKSDNSYDGKLISAPFNKSAYVFYYNTDDFKKAGITHAPRNWNEIEQDGIKLNKAGFGGLGLQANYYTFELLAMQAGSNILSKDQKSSALGGAEGKAALSFMKKLVDEKAATVIGGSAYLSDGFNTNKYGMDIDTVAAMSFITNPSTHYKVAPLPAGVQHAVSTAGTNLVVFKSASPAQKKAAAKYIDFLISKDSTIDWAEVTGYLPVRTSALHDKNYINYIVKNPNLGVAPYQLRYAYFSPRIASLYSGENDATTHIANCLSGQETVDEALKNIVNSINKSLAGN